MSAIGELFRKTLRAVVGDIAWTQPTWVAVSASTLRRGGAWVRVNPKRSGIIGGSVVAVLIAALLLWRWYENQPKPVEIAFDVNAPAVTCYACEPPGTPNPLIVHFSASAAPLEHVGHPLDAAQAAITLSPPLWRSN